MTIKSIHNDNASMCTPGLDLDTLRAIANGNSALINNVDLSSYLGRIVLLTYMSNRAATVSYKSYKSRHVACYKLSAEIIAFADLTDYALAILKQLKLIMNRPEPVQILTDSKNLFNIISK